MIQSERGARGKWPMQQQRIVITNQHQIIVLSSCFGLVWLVVRFNIDLRRNNCVVRQY